jgi:uncharacterized iron-regulated protein
MKTYASDISPYHRLRRFAALSALTFAALGCGTTTAFTPAGGYTLALGSRHPLVGQIIAGSSGQRVSSAQLTQAIDQTRYLVLGETHDNADHHLLQAELLAQFLESHTGASVGFEMLDEGDAVSLSQHPVNTPDELATLVRWADSGWPDFRLYRPVFDVALRKRAPLLAAHPSAEHVRASMHGVAPEEAKVLHIDTPLPDDQVQAQHAEIRESHCGHANEAMTIAMQHAQVYKDAFMARAMLLTQRPTALIAGRGHARKDRAVPYFLARMQAGVSVSIAFIDVDDAHTRATDYDIGAFDFVIFTPRVTDTDPCEEFRKQLEKMHRAPAPATSPEPRDAA